MRLYGIILLVLVVLARPLMAADPPGFVLWPKGTPPVGAVTRPIWGNHLMSIVRRNRDAGPEAHVRQSEIWVVQSGEANLLIGGELVDAKPNGPEDLRGSSIRNGIIKHISAGDVIHVQAGTPHEMIPEPGKELVYFAVKITGP